MPLALIPDCRFLFLILGSKCAPSLSRAGDPGISRTESFRGEKPRGLVDAFDFEGEIEGDIIAD